MEEIDLVLEEHNKQLERWEYVYNYIRPHQALDYLTPMNIISSGLGPKKPMCD